MSGNHLVKREYLNSGDAVQLECDTQVNFMLLDDANYSRYKRLEQFTYYGGHTQKVITVIAPPHSGNWNIVVDTGGQSAYIHHNLTIIRNR